MKKHFFKRMVLLLLIALVFTQYGNVLAMQSATSEYDNLRVKWKAMLDGGPNYDPTDPNISLKITKITDQAQDDWDTMNKSLDREYLWSDLPYSTKTTSYIANSYGRLKNMTLAYSTKGSSLFKNTSLLNDIIGGLDWLYTNWYNEGKTIYGNWYDWEIGTPLKLNDIVVMIYEDLTSQQIVNYMNAVETFSPDPTRHYNNAVSVGANRVDKCKIVAVRGVLVRESTKIATARDGLSDAFLYVTSGDGFYADGSYIQHTYIPYTGSYGAGMLKGIADLLYFLNDSTWEITDPNKSNVNKWVHDSFEPLLFKGAIMDMVMGRAIARELSNGYTAGHTIISGIVRLTQSVSEEEAAYLKNLVKYHVNQDTFSDYFADIRTNIDIMELARDIVNDPNVAPRGELIKNYTFGNMDRTVHQTQGFGFGISKSSKRIRRWELTNGENQKGWYHGDGVTYLYNNDLSQYADGYWCTVNNYRMPGTTVDTRARTWGEYQNGDGETALPLNSWSGGVSLDKYGISGMNLIGYQCTLNANKSWFMFDDEVVALGSDITSTDNRTIETIVEQRKINSEGNNTLIVNGAAKPTNLGWSETMDNVDWIHLAGNAAGADIGYYFPDSSTIKGLREERTGAWSDINTRAGVSTNPITRNYLTLWFDHGSNPTNDTYSYVLLPNKKASQVNAYASNPDITILENSSDAQGVKENNLNITGVNFWKDVSKTVDIITSNKKASVICKENPGKDIEIAISDPTLENRGTIEVEINKRGYFVISADPGVTVTQVSPTIKMSVNVSGSKGKPFNVKLCLDPNAPVPPVLDITATPIADVYVDGAKPDTNYGSATQLVIKDTSNSAYDRQAYLKFNISQFTGNEVTNAMLYFYSKAPIASTTWTAVGFTEDNWTEMSATYNNQPSSADSINCGSIDVDSIGWYKIDVTSYVNSQLNDKIVTLKLEDQNATNTYGAIYSKEYGIKEPYLHVVGITDNVPPVDADVNIDPDTLNLSSNGKVITAYIELAQEYEITLADIATIKLVVNGSAVHAQLKPTEIGDNDENGISDLMVKFNRQEIIEALAGNTGNVEMVITGELNDGIRFEGSDIIRVIK